MEYTGTLLSDINLTDKVFDGRFWKGCADKCRAHNQCGVATYYADTKKCILLKAGEATVLSADKRKVHSFVRCEAEEVGNGEEEEEEEGAPLFDALFAVLFRVGPETLRYSVMNHDMSSSLWHE